MLAELYGPPAVTWVRPLAPALRASSKQVKRLRGSARRPPPPPSPPPNGRLHSCSVPSKQIKSKHSLICYCCYFTMTYFTDIFFCCQCELTHRSVWEVVRGWSVSEQLDHWANLLAHAASVLSNIYQLTGWVPLNRWNEIRLSQLSIPRASVRVTRSRQWSC